MRCFIFNPAILFFIYWFVSPKKFKALAFSENSFELAKQGLKTKEAEFEKRIHLE